MQYITYSNNVYKKLTNPNTLRDVRVGQRYGMLVYDYELTDIGFDGIENVDWICFKRTDCSVNGTLVREGVRNENYVKDAEIVNGSGFDGTENIDWENLDIVSDAARDGHTIAWWDHKDLYTITKNENNNGKLVYKPNDFDTLLKTHKANYKMVPVDPVKSNAITEGIGSV